MPAKPLPSKAHAEPVPPSYGDGQAPGLLQAFGLSGQEAAVYLSLLQEGELNGYEAAKTLAISRSNAYTALAGLVEKGAAWLIEGAPVRYTAVPAAEFCADRLRRMAQARDHLLAIVPRKKAVPGSYVTIRGRERILDRLRHLLEEAQERVYLGLEGSVLELYVKELTQLLARGKKVVLITDGSGIFQGAKVYRAPIAPGQIRAIADSRSVMTGELGVAGAEATCLFSDHPNLVQLFKTALRNEIKLIELEPELQAKRESR